MSKIYENEIIAFNNGREYTEKGQRIAMAKLFDGRVMFYDVDRMISGITRPKAWTLDARRKFVETVKDYDRHLYDIGTTIGFVMWCYDYGLYSGGAYDPDNVYTWEDLLDLENKLQKVALAL